MRSTFNTMHSRAHCLTLAVVDRAENRRSCAIHGQNDVEGQRSTPTRRSLVCPPGIMCIELLSQRLIEVSPGNQEEARFTGKL